MSRLARLVLDDPRVHGPVLVLLAVVAYLPALSGDYLWDDTQYVIYNADLDTLGGLARIWFAPGALPQHYPLTFTTFWVEVQLWGRLPLAHHLVNALLHGLAALLLWRLLRRLEVRAAWLAAALFALHPVCVESVAWITERKNVLSLPLALGSALLYLRYANLGGPAREGRDLLAENSYLPSALLFLAALFGKTAVAVLPVVLLVLLWWKRPRFDLREDAVPLLPFAALGILTGLLTAWLERVHVGAQGPEWSMTFPERLLLAGRAPWFYAGKLLLPWKLTFIYPRWRIDASAAWQYAFPLALAGVVAALWLLRRRLGRGPLAAVLIYVAALFPALGFFAVYPMRFSFVADHFQYHAAPALLALAASALALAAERLRWTAPARRGAAAALLTLLGFATWAQAGRYRDQETLWRDTLAKNPDAWIAHSNLAEILVARGDLDEAIRHCRRALELRPDLVEARGNLANALFLQGDAAGAREQYHRILARAPGNAAARNNLGAVLEAEGRLEEAAAQFREVTVVAPEFAEAHYNLANVLIKLDRLDEASRHLARLLRLDGGHYRGRMRMADVRFAHGNRLEGERQLREALRLARAAGDERAAAEAEARLRFYGVEGS